MSVPMPSGTWKAATDAADPPDEPPGTRSSAHGLAVGPNALCSVDEPIANSSMLVLPRMTAPASRSRSVMWASYGRDVALEDPRAGGRLAAAHRDEVLERDGHAEQRMGGRRRRPDRLRAPPPAGRRRRRLRRGRARGRSSSQALSAWFWRSASARCASVSSRDEISPARSAAAISWACRARVEIDVRGHGRRGLSRRGSPARR